MIVRAVTVWVKSQFETEFERATFENHRGSLLEPGVLRFDVLKCEERSGEYLLYEVYQSEEAVQSHKSTSHYKKWRETVEPWMEKARSGSGFTVLAPLSEDAW